MQTALNEQRLAKLCSARDESAQRELYDRYSSRLFTLCRRYSNGTEEARDLLHDAFVKIYEKIPGFQYRGEGSLYAWICRLTINLALNHMTRRKIRLTSLDLFVFDHLPAPDDSAIESLPAEVMLEMVSSLPETQRAVFNMFCIEDYSHRDIAEMLGISEKGSASILAKARASLKLEIKDYLKNQH